MSRAVLRAAPSPKPGMVLPEELCCPVHREPLVGEGGGAPAGTQANFLVCRSGCRVPVVRGVARFVSSPSYAAGFGEQWKKFRRT
ncbi:MAG: hypothetical protein ACREFH_18585, partial [Stellaceae bacterium]